MKIATQWCPIRSHAPLFYAAYALLDDVFNSAKLDKAGQCSVGL